MIIKQKNFMLIYLKIYLKLIKLTQEKFDDLIRLIIKKKGTDI